MKEILLLLLTLFCFSCDEKLPETTRNNCVDLEFNKACSEVSKRGIGRKFCEKDQKCNLVCEPLDKEIHRQCCYNNDTYRVFIRKQNPEKW